MGADQVRQVSRVVARCQAAPDDGPRRDWLTRPDRSECGITNRVAVDAERSDCGGVARPDQGQQFASRGVVETLRYRAGRETDCARGIPDLDGEDRRRGGISAPDSVDGAVEIRAFSTGHDTLNVPVTCQSG